MVVRMRAVLAGHDAAFRIHQKVRRQAEDAVLGLCVEAPGRENPPQPASEDAGVQQRPHGRFDPERLEVLLACIGNAVER